MIIIQDTLRQSDYLITLLPNWILLTEFDLFTEFGTEFDHFTEFIEVSIDFFL